MTVKIAGHWEIGYHAPVTEAYYWNVVLREFQIKDWLMVPVSGIKNNEEREITLTEFSDYDSMLESTGDLTRVFLEPRTNHQNPDTTWLHEFEHPEDCVYIFGSAHYNPTIGYKRPEDHVVTIKTRIDHGLPWSNQCLAIVLYDRMIKECQLQ